MAAAEAGRGAVGSGPTSASPGSPANAPLDETPPAGLPSWRALYALVLGALVVQILLYAALAASYPP